MKLSFAQLKKLFCIEMCGFDTHHQTSVQLVRVLQLLNGCSATCTRLCVLLRTSEIAPAYQCK